MRKFLQLLDVEIKKRKLPGIETFSKVRFFNLNVMNTPMIWKLTLLYNYGLKMFAYLLARKPALLLGGQLHLATLCVGLMNRAARKQFVTRFSLISLVIETNLSLSFGFIY